MWRHAKIAAGWSYLSKDPTNRLVVGLGMMPRGEVGLIFLGLGTQAGILTPALEAGILLMVIGTKAGEAPVEQVAA